MKQPKNANEFGLFAAFSVLYVASNRTLFLARPSPSVAIQGLPAMVIAYALAAVIIAVFHYTGLAPYWRLGRSVYQKAARRSFVEYAAIVALFCEQILHIVLQTAVYSQGLKAFSFFRTPRWVMGVSLASILWFGVRLKNTAVIRAGQVWLFFQLLLLPLLVVPLRGWSAHTLHGFMHMPTISGVLSLLPTALALYHAGGSMLLVANVGEAKTVRNAIPLTVLFKFVTYTFGGVAVATILGPSLLRLSPYPLIKYLESTRTPGLERYDLILLFGFANVTLSAMVLVGRAAVQGLEVFGIPSWIGATIVCGFLIAASTFVVIPGTVQPIAIATIVVIIVTRVLLLMLPSDKGAER